MRLPQRLSFAVVGGALAVLRGCRSEAHAEREARAVLTSSHERETDSRSAWLREETACLQRIDEAWQAPASPLAPAFEQRRAHILARAKGEPVLLLETPRAPAVPSRAAARWLREIANASAKAVALFRRYPQIVQDESVAREVLLRDGYLYSDEPALAFGLSHVVKLEDLFSAQRLWLQRGSRTLELERVVRNGEPFYVESPARPGLERRATLLFLDRVASAPEQLVSPLHRDVSAVQEQLGFESAIVRHADPRHVVLDADYAGDRVLTLLESDGASLSLLCEALPPHRRAAIEAFRQQRLARRQQVELIKAAIREQLDESLPFDEPRTEFGQEDGKLRDAWLQAYYEGRSHYSYNEDRYWVYARDGRPNVPQVCIDFIADTLERAAGTWFEPKGQGPRRRVGTLDFDQLDLESRRRVDEFVAFARRHPEWFDVWTADKLVPLRHRRRFFDHVFEQRAELQPGDVVVIYGLRDDEKPHYHSFFVFAADPLTGMPIQLASNAVRPQIRSWEAEMHNAPRRSIRVRVRPRSSWLARVFRGDSRSADPSLE